jgi:SAM-dependent methyltransferase
MTAPGGSVPPAYFSEMYRRDSDPWKMRTSDYERDKYRETLAMLPPRRFRRALEVGCSIGVLTGLLAEHCELLLAIDVDDLPLREARATCRDRPNVVFEKRVVPGEWPQGSFDLVVFSEVLYFLDQHDIEAAARRTISSASADACVVLVNWLGPTDTQVHGELAADLFIAASREMFAIETQRRTRNYRMDVLVRARGRSALDSAVDHFNGD